MPIKSLSGGESKNSTKLKAVNCHYFIVAARAGYPRAVYDEESSDTTAGLNPSGMTRLICTDIHAQAVRRVLKLCCS